MQILMSVSLKSHPGAVTPAPTHLALLSVAVEEVTTIPLLLALAMVRDLHDPC